MDNNGVCYAFIAISLSHLFSAGECTPIRSSAAFVGDLFVISCDSNVSNPTSGFLLQSPNSVTSSQVPTAAGPNTNSTAEQPVDWLYRSSPDVIQMIPLSSDGHIFVNYTSRYSVDKTIRHETNLVIHNVQPEDTGEYSCQRNGVSTVVARLSVFDFARREPTTTVSAFVGDDIALQCITGEAPVDWWYERSETEQAKLVCSVGNIIDSYVSRFSLDTAYRSHFNLIIRDLEATDTGVYTCIDNGGFGRRTIIMLNVFHAENDVVKLTRIGSIGSTILMPCNTNMSSASGWLYQSAPHSRLHRISLAAVVSHMFRSRFHLDMEREGHYNLIVDNAAASDSGVYICREDAGAMRDTYVILEITDVAGERKPAALPTPSAVSTNAYEQFSATVRNTLIGGPKNINATFGQTVVLKCTTNGLHPVAWQCVGRCSFYQREPLQILPSYADNGRVSVVSTTYGGNREYSLKIINITEENAGVYTCSDGSGTASASIDVGSAVPERNVAPTSAETTSSSQKYAMIAGIAIGTSASIAIIVISSFCCLRRRKSRQKSVPPDTVLGEMKSELPLLHANVSEVSPGSTKEDSACHTSRNWTSQSIGGNDTWSHSNEQFKTQKSTNTPSSADVLDASIQCYSEFIHALEQLDNRTKCGGSSQWLENLADFLARNYDILDMLTANGCLSYEEKRKIEIKDMARVVDIIMKRSTDDLKKMIVCCQQHKRDDGTKLLTEVIHERRSSISMGLPLLRYILETRFHFRQKLCEGGVLTEDEASDVLTKRTAYDQSDQILLYLNQKPDKRQEFLNVLEETNQSHVSKYMQSSTDGDDRPLGLPQLLLITNNFQKLVGLMHPHPAFIDNLVKEKYISFEQKKYIEKSHEFDEKNRKLLDMLTRRSVTDFNKFITLLMRNKQTEAAEILSGVTR